jgi:large subunit ribosomal protein L6
LAAKCCVVFFEYCMFSRIGSSSISIDKYKVDLVGNKLKINHKSASYDYEFDKNLLCEISGDGASLKFLPNIERIRNKAMERKVKKIAGFHVRDLQNLLSGIVVPFKMTLDLIGTGYKVVHNKPANFLNFSLGFSHNIVVTIPKDVIVEVVQNKINLTSSSKMILGGFASYLSMSLRKYDKFKGKGVIISGKYMQRKELKKK